MPMLLDVSWLGYTAVMWAADNGHLPCVTALAEAKADLNLQANDGKSLISGLSQSLARLRWSSVPLSLSLSLRLCVSFFVRVTSRKTLTNSLFKPNMPNGWEVSLATLTLSIRLIERKRGRECLIILIT